jgi:SAM-dependent MidA family methyltransferase
VRWLDTLPDRLSGVVVGNEVLDAMPVQLLHFDGQPGSNGAWCARARAWPGPTGRPRCARRPSAQFVPGTVTEIHPQAEAFVRTLADACRPGLRPSSSTTASPSTSTTTPSATPAR